MSGLFEINIRKKVITCSLHGNSLIPTGLPVGFPAMNYMTEDEWKRMIDEYKNHKDNWNNVYGECFTGGVCCDFVNTIVP